MRFIFRADASTLIGSGHVARLLALAEEALSRGIECIFFGDISEPKWLLHRFASLQIRHISDTSSSHFTIQKSDVLFIDSYNLNVSDPFICSKLWAKTILLADSSTPAYRSDLVFFIEDLRIPERFLHSQVEHGFKFFPLKKSIVQIESTSREVKKILVVGGGTDPFNFASIMSQILCAIEGFEKAIFMSGNLKSIRDLDSRFEVLNFGNDLDVQIEDSDLVFSTASTIALETIARGLPLGIACAVENQRSFYDYLASKGAAVQIGHRDLNQSWELNSLKIQQLINDDEFRNSVFNKYSKIVDNLGSARVIDKVIENFEGQRS